MHVLISIQQQFDHARVVVVTEVFDDREQRSRQHARCWTFIVIPFVLGFVAFVRQLCFFLVLVLVLVRCSVLCFLFPTLSVVPCHELSKQVGVLSSTGAESMNWQREKSEN